MMHRRNGEATAHLVLRICVSVLVAVGVFHGQGVLCVDTDVRLVQGTNANLGEALQFLREYDTEASGMCFRVSSAQWAYATNMTDYNKRRMVEEQTLKAKFDKLSWRRAVMFDWTRIPDPMTRRQIRMLVTNSKASLTDDKYNEVYHLISEMKDLYSQTRICPLKNDYDFIDAIYCDLELSNVQKIMGRSRNRVELTHAWKEWHDKLGPQLKNKFMRYVELANQAARLSGFLDYGEEMRYIYDDDDFENELAESFQKLLPLYKELFTYVRRKLFEKYGPQVLRPDGPIPADILGNLWAQDWSNIFDIVAPYNQYKNIDVTDEMIRQGFTPLRMFQMAEEFYLSLGLESMPPEFWRFSMLERPNSRKVQCTASAWDFCNKIDYRIKQCSEVNMENLITTHHEMAHIEYYLYYKEQPFLYRDGANPGFHEGVANAMVLSVFNPVHFHRVGLFNNNTESYELNINFLMLMALKKVAYVPFAYLIDQWRYEIFETGVNKMNSIWWDLRLRYQGITPPVPRTEFHFDAAAKRHVIADIPYIRYYISLLLEFQIHKSMCLAAGNVGPLHNCDVYRSREAGRVLIDLMKVGRARHWKEVIKMLTQGHSDKLSSEPMLEYFQPLLQWLKEANRGEKVVGWTTIKDDVAKFQPLTYRSSARNNHFVNVVNIVIIVVVSFLNVVY